MPAAICISLVEHDDDELVARSMAGDVRAFGEIAARYYPLLLALAYEATGSLGESDNLARDTFIAAWRHFRNLRQPVKLRSWLCGIARGLIDDFLAHRAESQSADVVSGTALARSAGAIEPAARP